MPMQLPSSPIPCAPMLTYRGKLIPLHVPRSPVPPHPPPRASPISLGHLSKVVPLATLHLWTSSP